MAELTQRGFDLDVLACDCGGRREVIALIKSRDAIERILRYVGIDHEPVIPSRARAPPRPAFAGANPASSAPPTGPPAPDPWDYPDPQVDDEELSQEVAW